MIVNPKDYRLIVLKHGLALEIQGMRTSRGPTCYSRVKKEFNLKGSKKKVYFDYCKLLERYFNQPVPSDFAEVSTTAPGFDD